MMTAKGLSVKKLLEWRDRSFSSLETLQVVDSWVARRRSSPLAPTLDQERRLQVEEWMRAHSVVFRPQQLVCGLRVERSTRLEHVRTPALGRALERHGVLRSHFVADLMTGESREQVLAGTLRGAACRELACIDPRVRTAARSRVQEIAVPGSVSAVDEPAIQAVWTNLTAPFDVSMAPLMRAALVGGSDDTRALFLAVDRLIADWWSIALLVDGLAEGLGSGAGIGLRTVPGRFLSERQERQLARAAVTHWREQWLEPAALPIEMDDIPLSLPRSDLGAAAFGWRSTTVSAETARGLAALARRLSLDLGDVILGAVITVLQHVTQKTTVSLWMDCRSALSSTAEIGPGSRTLMCWRLTQSMKATSFRRFNLPRPLGSEWRHIATFLLS